MTPTQSLLARLVLGTVAGATTVGALSIPKLFRIPRQKFDRLILGGWAASRFGLFLLVFVVLHIEPRGDIHIYLEQGSAVLHGWLPYRDFLCSYAPLFPYLSAASLEISRTGLATIFFGILCEGCVLWLWLRMAREWFSESQLRVAALLYVTSGVGIHFVTIDGQNNIIDAMLISLAFYFMARHRNVLSGFCIGFAVALVKFLPLLYMPALFIVSRRRWPLLAGFVIGCVPVYAMFGLMHLNVLQPLSEEGALRSAGNLPFLVELVTGWTLPGVLWDGVLGISFLLIFGLMWRTSRDATAATRMRALTFGVAAITIALLLFSKKSWPPYLVMALFPLCLVPGVERLQGIPFACFNVMALLENSVWATLFKSNRAVDLHAEMMQRFTSAVPLLASEFFLLLGYVWLLCEIMKGLFAVSDEEQWGCDQVGAKTLKYVEIPISRTI